MARLGSRLFFLVMDTQTEVTEEDLVASIEGLSYGERLAQCRGVIHGYITALLDAYNGRRTARSRWPGCYSLQKHHGRRGDPRRP